MTKYSKYTRYIIVAISALTMLGCNKTPINTSTNANVVFSIEWPTTKSADMPLGSIYLYPVEGGDPIVFTGVNGSTQPTLLAAGKYNIIVHNENLSRVLLRNSNSYESFEGYLPAIASGKNNELQLIDQAEYLYLLTGTNSRQLEIVESEPLNVKLKPGTATMTYRFLLSIESTIKFKDVQASLSGLSSHLNLHTAKPVTEDICAMIVPLVLKADPTIANRMIGSGEIETFGIDPSTHSAGCNMLVVDLIPEVTDPLIITHYENDLSNDLSQVGEGSLDIIITIKDSTVDPDDPDIPVDPDDPNGKHKVEITVTVRPWKHVEGGTIEVNPMD